MTKKVQTKILRQLYFLKSIGYEYYKNIDFESTKSQSVQLPNNLTALEEIAQNCHLCNLSKYRENVLFGVGNETSKIMFIKESPSISEDELGEFYVGKSGELLKNMIEKSLNLKVEDIYLTNLLKCTTANDTISGEHINYCKSYLFKQIEIIQPKLLVLLGEGVYQYFTNDDKSFNEVRGKVINYFDLDMITTYDASYLLRNPTSKAEAYQDMLKIKSIMEQM